MPWRAPPREAHCAGGPRETAMAATRIATIPMTLIVAFTQRYVLHGIATSPMQG